MDGPDCSEGTWLTPLKCGGLQTLLRSLCLGATSFLALSMFRLVADEKVVNKNCLKLKTLPFIQTSSHHFEILLVELNMFF